MVDVVFTTYKRPVWAAMTALGFIQQRTKPKRIICAVENDDVSTPVELEKVRPILLGHGIDLHIVAKEGVKGLVGCKNLALDLSITFNDTKWVFLIDDDLIFNPWYIGDLQDSLEFAAEEHPEMKIGGISGTILTLGEGAVSHSEPTTRLTVAPNRRVLQTWEAEINHWTQGPDKNLNKYQIHDWSDLPERDYLYELEYFVNSYWLSKDAIKATGSFNMELNTTEAVFEETEYTHRVHRNGYTLILDPSTSGYHITVGTGGIYKGLTPDDKDEYARRAKQRIQETLKD